MTRHSSFRGLKPALPIAPVVFARVPAGHRGLDSFIARLLPSSGRAATASFRYRDPIVAGRSRSRRRNGKGAARKTAGLEGVQHLERRLALAVTAPDHGGHVPVGNDVVAPEIRRITPPPAATYGAGDTLSFRVRFTEPVFVGGAPTLPIAIGDMIRPAMWDGRGSGTNRLTFTTTVEPGDAAAAGVRAAGAIDLVDGATIRDAAGNGLDPPASGTFSGVVVDAVAPVLSGVSVAGNARGLVAIRARFNEPVVVRGKPVVPFTIAGEPREAIYSGGSNGRTITFTYRRTRAENALRGSQGVVPLTPVARGDASIRDRTGNSYTEAAGERARTLSLAALADGTLTQATNTTAAAPAAATSFDFGIIGDPGNYRTNGTRFYYSPGGGWAGNRNINSMGPGQAAVAGLVQNFGVTDLINLGDLTYTTGASTLIDEANGLDYNHFMAPYPSPRFLAGPYQQAAGDVVWPYDIYNYPNGFPNPVTGGRGGSADGINRFWPTIGNHDYGLRIAYSETNIAQNSANTAAPVGPSATAVPQPYVDYFGWLADPSLLDKQTNVKVARADGTGQSGIYYSVELGGQTGGDPLLEIFSIDAQRLTINAGGYYQVSDGFGTAGTQSAPYNYAYDPTRPYVAGTATAAVLTTDPANGQAQFTWLVGALAASRAKWKIIMGHQPIYSSGQWGKTQPDDHMSNPVLQRVLNALPKGSFHAYVNGHAHYYQRVLEGNAQGIGQGIPFITNGNSGRILYAINETRYGDDVYSPSTPGMTPAVYNGANTPSGSISPFLLQSRPTTVGVSGGYKTTNTGLYTGTQTGFTAGAYGYGFGGQDGQATAGHLFFNYRQTDVLDPAITENLAPATRNATLAGWDGLTSADFKPALTAGMTSAQVLAATAQFAITVGTDGAISGVQITSQGTGYMASRGGNHVVDFEIRGNDSFTASQPNPNNYALVTLTFANGLLTQAALKSPGAGYTYLAQAVAANGGATNPLSSPVGNIAVPINTSLLESWYTVPFIDYQDWYLVADTRAVATAVDVGSFGGLRLSVQPREQATRDLLAAQPITTGYSGVGQQAKYDVAQQGTLTIRDSLDVQVGSGQLGAGAASVELVGPPAPGPLEVAFSGDVVSSYLVNYRPSTSTVNVDYGSWQSGLSVSGGTVVLADSIALSVTRSDNLAGSYSFGLRRGTVRPVMMLRNARPAESQALDVSRIYTPTGSGSWLESEGRSQGGRGAVSLMSAGTYTPYAVGRNGRPLAIESIVEANNAFEVRFAGGVTARYANAGTGLATNLPGAGQVTVSVQRLGGDSNGLAFYPADRSTGAITVGTNRILPGQPQYLTEALRLATSAGLVLSADQLPGYGGSATYDALPLRSEVNYGVLLLHNGSTTDLSSSYAAANPQRAVQMVSFVAPQRGVVIGIEDRKNGDFDFNDLVVRLTGSDFRVV